MSFHKRGGHFDHYSNGAQHQGKKARPSYGKPPHRSDYDQPAPQLSANDMQSGLVALLDRFVAAETTPAGDKDVLHHACELRRLLCSRKHDASAASKQELDQKRPDNASKVAIPAYIHRKVQEAKNLPPLPPITEPHIHEAVFTHQSLHATNESVHGGVNLGLDYERFEFLGDAYIEVIASRALYNRFPQVDIPHLSSWRERLVENSTLGKFSEAYGFPDRLKAKTVWDKDTKAWKKVVADIFEAYVAGIILSDPEHGFTTAENWLDQLWAPQLLSFKENVVENARAKDDLQKLAFVTHIKLEYKQERPMAYIDHAQRFYMGVYLTGWGYENEWLGSGEGQSKAQAAISAATDAIKRNNDVLVDAARQKKELMEIRAKEREEKAKMEAQTAAAGEQEGNSEATTVNLEKIESNDAKEKTSPEKKPKELKKEKRDKKRKVSSELERS